MCATMLGCMLASLLGCVLLDLVACVTQVIALEYCNIFQEGIKGNIENKSCCTIWVQNNVFNLIPTPKKALLNHIKPKMTFKLDQNLRQEMKETYEQLFCCYMSRPKQNFEP